MRFIQLLALLAPSVIFAAGSTGHGSATDLIPSFVNVIVLAGLLIWKAGPFVVSYFNNQAHEVDTVMRRAETKAKEASQMMAITSKKMSESDNEINQLKTNAKVQIDQFEANYKKEVNEKIDRLNKDALLKIEAEKKSLTDSVNELLVTEVVSKTKSKISASKDLKESSTQKILKDL